MKTSRKQEAATTGLVVLIILGIVLVIEAVVLFARWNTLSDLRVANAAKLQENLKEEAEIYTLTTFRPQIDATWVRLRESFIRPQGAGGLPAGFTSRPGREALPLQLGSFDSAGFTIAPQTNEPGVYDAGTDKLEWHRLLPLLGTFENSFVLVQADELRFTLPAAAAFFSPSPTALEFRARLRFPVERKPKPVAAAGATTAAAGANTPES